MFYEKQLFPSLIDSTFPAGHIEEEFMNYTITDIEISVNQIKESCYNSEITMIFRIFKKLKSLRMNANWKHSKESLQFDCAIPFEFKKLVLESNHYEPFINSGLIKLLFSKIRVLHYGLQWLEEL